MRHITGMFQKCDLDVSGGGRYDTQDLGGREGILWQPHVRLARHSSEGFVEGDDRDVDFHFAFGDGIFGLQLSTLGVE